MAGGIKGQPRLNRKRYAEATKALKQIIADKSQRPDRRVKCIELLLEIYQRHDTSVRQKVIQGRFEAKKAEAEQLEAEAQAKLGQAASTGTGLKETIDEFLARVKSRTEADALGELIVEDNGTGDAERVRSDEGEDNDG